MNTQIPLYQFTHDGHSIVAARIAQSKIAPGPQAGQETVELAVDIVERFWGNSELPKGYSFVRPEGIAHLKFPDPIWSRVNIRNGALLLVIFPLEGAVANPLYVDEIKDVNDPAYRQLKDILRAEREDATHQKTKVRYLAWLTSGGRLEKLYAGEALARDPGFHFSPAGITTYAKEFESEHDVYTKLSLGGWMWEYLFPGAAPSDQIKIINATLTSVKSPDENVRLLALDRISEVNPTLLRHPGLAAPPEAVRAFEERRRQETDPEEKRKLDEIVSILGNHR